TEWLILEEAGRNLWWKTIVVQCLDHALTGMVDAPVLTAVTQWSMRTRKQCWIA
ncbi:hypothetical protein L917_02172, partial [Phytophthora nicotianae]